MIWSDEFDGVTLNPKNWLIETGTVGRQNAEWEYYTDRPDNVRVENGNLVITALREKYEDYAYTSGRLDTQNLLEVQYGRIEARMKLPFVQGIWSAFSMLGNDFGKTKGWPLCGEMDILEYGSKNKTPDTVYQTIHGPGYSGTKGISSHFALTADSLKNDFHVYAIEWAPNEIRWFVDDQEVFKVTPDQIPAGTEWVYDHPFFIILNLAVGGGFTGYPDDTTVFPQQLLVDYVRVYQKP